MMEGAAGRTLVDDALAEAISFRQEMADVAARMTSTGAWWFSVFQPPLSAGDAGSNATRGGTDRALEQDTWLLATDRSWHGFPRLLPGEAMLDPVKVTMVTPGIGTDGRPDRWGIPASLVSSYLRSRGVVVEKTGYYSILVLFSIAVTRGKSGTLLAELFDFHRAYEANTLVAAALPGLAAVYPERYADIGLRDLAAEMHEFLSGYDTAHMQEALTEHLPTQVVTPAEAFAALVNGQTEQVPLGELEGRTCAVTCLLYPPGIPVVVPGERFDSRTRPVVDYLQLFERWEAQFPGFENEVQGVVKDRSAGAPARFTVSCLLPRAASDLP